MSGKTENRPATPGAKTEVNEVKRGDHAEVVRTSRGDQVSPRARKDEELPELKDDAVLVVEKGKTVTLETTAQSVTEGTEVKASDVQGGVEGARVLLKKHVVRVK